MLRQSRLRKAGPGLFGTRMAGIPEPGASPAPVVSLRLYLSRNGLRSQRALADLRSVCARYFDDAWELEVIDIMEHPQRALSDGVLVTPTLLKLSPPPFSMITGDLTQMRKVLALLGVRDQV